MRRIFEAVYQVFFDKKWGILIKMESESLIFTCLEIPRDYFNEKEDRKWSMKIEYESCGQYFPGDRWAYRHTQTGGVCYT